MGMPASKLIKFKSSDCSSGYGKPPWIFRGKALYQLHLVKADIARAFIPKEFKLVEAFGYTLGGLFLANYEDSPAGTFDELVVIAGTVWNPPTSCAWAARVLVDSKEACSHGRKEVGLPSQVAKFSKKVTAISKAPKSKISRILEKIGMSDDSYSQKNQMDIHVSEITGQKPMDLCNISLAPVTNSHQWMGPLIKLSLPSFSGRTKYNPHLMKYSCQIECRVRAVRPAKVMVPSTFSSKDVESSKLEDSGKVCMVDEAQEDDRNLSLSVLLSKPIFALEFNCLKMRVEAPSVISNTEPFPSY
ncbi:hypothetical protein Leryth_017234 [Lithospermum erythrorhizon]|uniref:Protein NEOXANTHIN-DEFICIENT 1 n=1 Tax=Lithospermum erythrorhizon TaxID=34254 RepID=A0AAV3Q669_LITER|nr:hypothetical protein Leryth_017234 [Lithospermum erythrorhizon]